MSTREIVRYSINKIQDVSIAKIKKDYLYGLVYKISDMLFLKTSELNDELDINQYLDECIEARFFYDKGELRIFRTDDNIKCVEISDIEFVKDIPFDQISEEENSNVKKAYYIDEQYEMSNRFKEYGRLVKERKYITPDEDGQMIVINSRLVGIGGE